MEKIMIPNKEVSMWFTVMATSAKMEDLKSDTLLSYFKKLGAKELNIEGITTLKEYLPGKASDAMEEFWGTEKIKKFKVFLPSWTNNFDSQDGNRELQKTKPSNEIGVGMKRFFLELTQYACGVLDYETFKDRTESALVNGVLWQQFKDDHMIKRSTPETIREKKDPIKVASIAPGFIPDFINWLDNSSK